MKLIYKTLLYYTLLLLPLIALATLTSYYILKNELQENTDEWLMRKKLNYQKILSTKNIQNKIFLDIDSLSYVTKVSLPAKPNYKDTLIYNAYEQEYSPYRVLTDYLTQNNQYFQIVIFQPLIEQEEILESVLLNTGILLMALFLTFIAITQIVSKKLWKGFYDTLQILHQYSIQKEQTVQPQKTGIQEFDILNEAISQMTKKIHSDYTLLKEFTENAAHELQTPVAILKNKLDILIQSPNLTENELTILSDMEYTLQKLITLNKALLLIAKIENHQFTEKETVCINTILDKLLSAYQPFIEEKKIHLSKSFEEVLYTHMHPHLADILCSNLITNAIRHNTPKNGTIHISVKNHTLTISNTGINKPLPEKNLFVRFKKQTTTTTHSTGLGLAIIKSICNIYSFNVTYTFCNNMHQFQIQFDLLKN